MAYTWRTSQTGSSAGATITVVEPTSAASGDWEFVLISVSSNAITVATPSGWTLFADSGAGANTRFYIFYVTGGRGASAPGLNFTASGGAGHEWHCLGVAGSNVTIDASATQAIATGTNPDPPSATAIQTSDESIAIGFNFAGATWVTQAGYTIRSLNSGGLDCVASSKDLVGSGAENPAVFTGPGAANDIFAATILLQAAADGLVAYQPWLSRGPVMAQ